MRLPALLSGRSHAPDALRSLTQGIGERRYQSWIRRYDTLSDVRRYLPPALQIMDVRGIRVVTPFSQVHDLPLVGRAFGWAETIARDAPLLRRLGGFMVVIAEKR